MRKIAINIGWIPVLLFSAMLLAGIDQTTTDALKVGHLLRTIERETQQNRTQKKTAEVTEKELNAYIAHQIGQEKASIIKSVEVSLLEKNHVKGLIRFDATSLNLASLLGELLDFDFTGILYSRNGKAKMEFISLHLCGHPVKPQVLDFVLDTAASASGVDVLNSKGWYTLPSGIREMNIDKKKLILSY
jgi:hypothetical protein